MNIVHNKEGEVVYIQCQRISIIAPLPYDIDARVFNGTTTVEKYMEDIVQIEPNYIYLHKLPILERRIFKVYTDGNDQYRPVRNESFNQEIYVNRCFVTEYSIDEMGIILSDELIVAN